MHRRQRGERRIHLMSTRQGKRDESMRGLAKLLLLPLPPLCPLRLRRTLRRWQLPRQRLPATLRG